MCVKCKQNYFTLRMTVMLIHLPEQDKRGLRVFKDQLALTSKLQLGNLLRIPMEMVKHRVNIWNLSNNEKQDLYLLLWEIFQDTNKRYVNVMYIRVMPVMLRTIVIVYLIICH